MEDKNSIQPPPKDDNNKSLPLFRGEEYESVPATSNSEIPSIFFTTPNPLLRKGIGVERKENGTDKTFANRVIMPKNFKKQKHKMEDLSQYTAQQVLKKVSCQNRVLLKGEDPSTCHIEIDDTDELNDYFDISHVKKINDLKTEFDHLDLDVFRTARNNTNPYEKMERSVFQNRAAVKMANLDKVAGMCSIPLLPEEEGKIYFADICSGPGGFTEYMYWKYKASGCKGWGFTLKGKDDFRLDRFNPEAVASNFDRCYGVDHTGNIYLNENIQYLGEKIDKVTNGRGVALCMADGGFHIAGDYNRQELITKQIVMAQFLTALYVLRKGGNFMCKVFDMYHMFSSDLFFIMYNHFQEVGIVKPYTSRVANSERYVICKGLIQRRAPICDYLFRVQEQFNNKRNVKSIILQNVIKNDEIFVNYLRDSINSLAERQEHFLACIKKAVEDDEYTFEPIQEKLAKECLREWNLPEERTVLYGGGYHRRGGYRRYGGGGYRRGGGGGGYYNRGGRNYNRGGMYNHHHHHNDRYGRGGSSSFSSSSSFDGGADNRNEWEDDDEDERKYIPNIQTSSSSLSSSGVGSKRKRSDIDSYVPTGFSSANYSFERNWGQKEEQKDQKNNEYEPAEKKRKLNNDDDEKNEKK